MSVWDIRVESEEICFGDASVSLHRIKEPIRPQNGDRHAHSYYELHILLQGSYMYRLGDERIEVKSGEMLIIMPDKAHNGAAPKAGTQIAILRLSVRALPEGACCYPHFIECLDAHAGRPILLSRPLLHRIASYSLSQGSKSVRGLCHRKLETCEIIVGLFDLLDCQGEIASEPAIAKEDITLETLIQNPEITLREIAARFGYSERQLYRKIKSRYGKSFRQLRKEML